tara:strand:- start:217473 stop:218030 length:558 start_codon:yes stop_codon:yes gene_type:complete
MTKKRNKQSGGTLLGMIVGLIIGLAIAVGIALYVTKTSLPFINKYGTQERITAPAGSEPTDPNKAMYGKKTPIAPVQPAATAPNSDSTAAKIEAAKAAAALSDSGDDKWIYYLQAGAFRGAADADSLRAKLALMGFDANVSEHPSDSGTLYRVRIGPFGKVETMNRIREKLSDNGVDVAVVRIGK